MVRLEQAVSSTDDDMPHNPAISPECQYLLSSSRNLPHFYLNDSFFMRRVI